MPVLGVTETMAGRWLAGRALCLFERKTPAPENRPSQEGSHSDGADERTARLIASAEMARDTSLNPGSGPKTGAGFGR